MSIGNHWIVLKLAAPTQIPTVLEVLRTIDGHAPMTRVKAGAGLLAGWWIGNGFGHAFAGFGLLLFYAHALSSVVVYIGLKVRNIEVVNNAVLVVIFPLTFVANAVVPGTTLPRGLQTFANWNPVSAITQASRELFGNILAGAASPHSWPLQHPVLYTLGCGFFALVVFVPLSVRTYSGTRRK